MNEKIIDKKRSIGDAAREIGVETHVIRFWELKFPQIKPAIGKGKRRYYFDQEIAVLNKIKSLLYDEGYSISGLQKLLGKKKGSPEKADLKAQNLEFLLSISNPQETERQDFALDDFIVPDLALNHEEKDNIQKIVIKIESALDRLLLYNNNHN